ncbi:MAG TPA: phosphotransferase [Micromonosporaceae bacterium]|nr:phosphotransferase [Micromonosporaceae bacterium]
MNDPVATALDLDAAARRVARDGWGLTAVAERVDVGVNKATWRIGEHWLTCDFPRAAEQVGRMRTLLSRLASTPGTGLAVPRLVPAADEPVVHAEGRVWWLTEHVDGRQPEPASPADTAAVAVGLARLHSVLRGLPATLAVSTEDSVALFEAGVRLAADPRLGFAADDRRTVDEAEAAVRDRLDELRSPGTQLVHGDPSHPNLRVYDDPVRLTGALDWDHSRVDLALADVATVAQTVVFRSGSATPLTAVDAMLRAYLSAGGVPMTLDDVLVGLVLAKFESIAHHGARYLRGETGQGMAGGQVDKIRAALGLRAAAR